MLPTRTRRFKREKLLPIWLVCFCIGALMTVSCTQKTASTGNQTTAQELNAQASTTTAPPNSVDDKARDVFAHGEALHAEWTVTSLRQATERYDKAALLWTSVSDFPRAAEATLKAGDVYFILNEYQDALKRYENAAALGQKTGDWLGQAIALSQMGRVQCYLGDNNLAQKRLTQALDLFQRHETNRTDVATNAYGEALSNLAEVSYAKGDFVNASLQLDNALKVFHEDRKGEARVRLFKGYIAGSIGETDKAVMELSRGRELYREMNDKIGEGLTLSAMGLSYSRNKDHHAAIEMHDKAREIFRAVGDQRSEGIALIAIGESYRELAEYSTALFNYKNALALLENIGATDAVSAAKYGIASTLDESRQFDEALTSYEDCLRLSRATGNRRIEAYALKGIAGIYGSQGHHELASIHYLNLEKFFKSIDDRRGEAMALNTHGEFLLQHGEKQKALDIFTQARGLSEKMGDKGILLPTLYNLARANEALGLHDDALSRIKESFDLIQNIRANVESPDFRASYFSSVGKYYDLYIEILMQLHRLHPEEGFAAQAFSISEQGRARLLLDLLSESLPKISAGADKGLVEREHELRGLLRWQAESQLNLFLSGKDSTELTAQITQLRSEYQSVLAKLKEQNPHLFSFEQFKPVDLKRIQKELQGSDTMLLEYALGDEHSYLWAVTSDSSESHILPARKEIEAAASEFYKIITARQGIDHKDYPANVTAAENLYLEKATKLSQMLLAPVADKLQSRRIVVVADGALQYIPFDSLPAPFKQTTEQVDASEAFLIATNEVSVLPSASTLVAIRGTQKHKDSAGKIVSIIADPVFDASDERLQREALSASVKAAAAQNTDQVEQQTIQNLHLARLRHASEEADAIANVAPWGTTLMAEGFDATLETAISSEVRRSEIVHFATHSFLDSKQPELSGIVLTSFDRNGATKNSFMTLPDIYSLDLSADLVVLSACETALGKDVKGEGLVGVAHSFMSAGAKSVVASLWNVDDRATAVLMGEFYKGMLEKGMTPSAALRAAKLKMMHDKQWSAPYYWAGFVLQGEYTNHITVDRHPWLRPGLVLLSLLILIAGKLLIIQKQKRRIPPGQVT